MPIRHTAFLAGAFVLSLVSGPALCQGQQAASRSVLRLPQGDRPLEARFADPPASARILKIIHAQPADPTAQDGLLQALADQGFGGFAGNVAFDGYLEDESKWPPFLRGVREAKELGMALWLYDERGYPSGSAGDLTLRGHPDWAARGLLVAEARTSGGEVVLDVPPGKLVLASALPVREGRVALDSARDLSSGVKDGKLSWQAPAGDWRVFAMTDDLIYENTHAAISLAMKAPCINLLMPETTARFLEVTHDRYAARLGPDLGRWFVATFTDEPSLMNYWFKPMPWRVLPWAPGLAAEFQKRRGSELVPLLPALVSDAGQAAAKARHDFWLTVGELVSENYFGQIQDWCGRHGLLSGGHLLMEEDLTAHVPLYGDFFRCARRMDSPGIDCLTSVPSEVPWRIARLLSSVAELEGRSVTMCETSDHAQRYRRPGDERPVRVVTEDEIRGTCNRLLFGGINTITSYYSFAGLEKEALRRLNLHVGSCSTMLAGGHQVTDVAVLYPIESVWAEFVPAYQGATDAPAARQVEQAFRGVAEALYGENRDFRFIDSRALLQAKVEGGGFVHGALRWRVVVLPQTTTLPLAAWEKLAQFHRDGGIVIAMGALPANSERKFPDAAVQVLAAEMFGHAETGQPRIAVNARGGAGVFLPTGMTALLPVVLDRLIERELRCEGSAALRATHRRVDGHDVYFVMNDSGESWEGKVQLRGIGRGERWDPATGRMEPLPDGPALPLNLGPYGAVLFRFPAAGAPSRLQTGGETLPAFSRETLPVSPPQLGKGQFVQAALSGNASEGWQAAATLTRSEVDTHLFLSFELPADLDLSRAQGVAVDTTVPEGQGANAQILVILHEKGGADYIAGTGRFLDDSGEALSQVLFSQFSLCGWSKDANGRLDPQEITAVRVGWGGYFGKEGERIELRTGSPESFTLR